MRGRLWQLRSGTDGQGQFDSRAFAVAQAGPMRVSNDSEPFTVRVRMMVMHGLKEDKRSS